MRRVLPLILLAHACLLLLPGGVSICVHSDGTWKLESTAFPCCAGRGTSGEQEPRHGPEAGRDGCEDCTDYAVPTVRDAAIACSVRGTAPAQVASLAVLELPQTAVVVAPELWDLRDRPLRRPPPPGPRTTTVLRC